MIILQHLPYGETENFQKKAVAKFRCGGFVAVDHAVSPSLVSELLIIVFQASHYIANNIVNEFKRNNCKERQKNVYTI